MKTVQTNIVKDYKKTIKKKSPAKKKKVVVIKEQKDLTHKQIMFCEEYLKTQNATQSYLLVYQCKNEKTASVLGCKALANISIKKYIEDRIKPIEQKAIADANEVLEFFTKVVRGEIQDQLGFETSVRDRINAGKELGKRYGIFKDPTENPVGNDLMHEMKITVVDNSNLEKALYDSDKK